MSMGLLDDCFGASPAHFEMEIRLRASQLASAADYSGQLAAKARRRAEDEADKPLEIYRAEELAHMKRNFYGFDPSYHVARYHFVGKTPHSWTPRHLGRHRDLGWRVPEESKL
jgi:putative two-component system hydrogenase maturation factor HypX/HoxX